MKSLDFGFVFSRVLHFYGMNYWEVMRLPIRTFWHLDRNINRLQAQSDLRAMGVSMATQTTKIENLNRFRDDLVLELDDPYKFDPIESAERDEEGFNQLRAMAKKR